MWDLDAPPELMSLEGAKEGALLTGQEWIPARVVGCVFKPQKTRPVTRLAPCRVSVALVQPNNVNVGHSGSVVDSRVHGARHDLGSPLR